MISVDTNLLFLGTISAGPVNTLARSFLDGLKDDQGVLISELALVEYYGLLRNPAVLSRPLTAPDAVAAVNSFRHHPRWAIVDHEPSVMASVWLRAASPEFARRRIFDLRLALSLLHHGVRHFATRNVRDFEGLGFERVWDPTA